MVSSPSACPQPELEALCNGTSPSPSPYPPHTRGSCDYDQQVLARGPARASAHAGLHVLSLSLGRLAVRVLQAGAMWDQRLKQYLLANGVAVVVVNPFQEDSWDAGPWWWGTAEGGGDQALFGALFPMLAAGKMGRLDLHRTVIRGWSGGAQMVSWLMQVPPPIEYYTNFLSPFVYLCTRRLELSSLLPETRGEPGPSP